MKGSFDTIPLISGLEEFEEKLNKMEETEMRKEKEEKVDKAEKGEGWLSYIAKEFMQLKTETDKELTQVTNFTYIYTLYRNLNFSVVNPRINH